MRSPKKHVAKDRTVTWQVRFRVDGKQTSETFTGERTALRFAQLLDALGPHAALKQMYTEEQAVAAIMLEELAGQFFDWKESRVRSDRTVADYRRDYRNWIKPIFGDRPADTITEIDVQNWVDAMSTGTLGGELAGRKLAPKTVADRHAVLYGIYSWAVAPSRGLLRHNPCIGTELPKRRRKPPKGLRPAEWQALHAALVRTDPCAADLAEFLLATGWRVSEGAALNAYAVEDYGEDQPLYVTMGQVVRRNAKGQHVIVQDAKSEASEGRRIKLDAEAAAMIRRRLAHVTGDGLVLTTRTGVQWHYANFLNRAWNPAVELAQLTRRPTPHWLRHTHVAWLIMSGAGLAEIQRRVGHESIDTTVNVYGRMVDDVSDDAIARFAAFRSQKPKAVKPTGSPELGG